MIMMDVVGRTQKAANTCMVKVNDLPYHPTSLSTYNSHPYSLDYVIIVIDIMNQMKELR